MQRVAETKPTANGHTENHEVFVKQLITVLNGLRDGNFTTRLPADWTGLEGRVADTFNDISARMENFNTSLVRMRRQVGEEGKIGERLPLGDSVGGWAERIEAINAAGR